MLLRKLLYLNWPIRRIGCNLWIVWLISSAFPNSRDPNRNGGVGHRFRGSTTIDFFFTHSYIGRDMMRRINRDRLHVAGPLRTGTPQRRNSVANGTVASAASVWPHVPDFLQVLPGRVGALTAARHRARHNNLHPNVITKFPTPRRSGSAPNPSWEDYTHKRTLCSGKYITLNYIIIH